MSDAVFTAPRRIVVGVSAEATADGTKLTLCQADRVTAIEALLLASKVEAEVHLVHVIDFLDARSAAAGADLLSHVEASLKPELVQLERDGAALGVACSYTLVWGKPWYELIRHAHVWGADLLVLSPHRETLSLGDRLVHGSTAGRILRKAPCPVWVVAPRAASGIATVLALIDRSPMSDRVVQAANIAAAAFGADKIALHCLEYPDEVVLHRLPDANRAVRQHHASEQQRALANLNEITGGQAAGWTVLLDDRWVVHRVPDVVAERQVDLVVLGSLSHGNIAGALLGSTANRILQRCQVSAWVLRPEGWVSPVRFKA